MNVFLLMNVDSEGMNEWTDDWMNERLNRFLSDWMNEFNKEMINE